MNTSKLLVPGKRFGKIVYLGRGQKIGHRYKSRFQCDCGKIVESYPYGAGTPVSNGHCGCARPSIKERFTKFLSSPLTNGCIEFTGHRNNKGYGVIGIDGYSKMYAHRFTWTIHRGDIPEGQCVLHKCDNPACCNIEHLFLGTVPENNLDCRQKGRHVSGYAVWKKRQLERICER